MNELVKLSTNDIKKAVPVTNSLIISEKLDYKHFRLTELIKKHISDFEEFGAITFETCLLNSKNVEIILLNENHFYLLVTYLRTSKKKPLVLELKKELVRQFSLMKEELLTRKETRQIGVKARKSLTDSVKEFVTDEDSNFKNFAFGNYTKLIYKKVFNSTKKDLEELYAVPKNKNLRDYIPQEKLAELEELENQIAVYLRMTDKFNKTDKEVYQDIKKYLGVD